jgi:hypothetical protein
MSVKNNQENKKNKFNGEGVVDFELFSLEFKDEANKRGCGNHFIWKPEDVNDDGTVPEETFLHNRPCPPGQEQAFALTKKGERIAAIEKAHKRQVRVLKQTYPAGEVLRKKIAEQKNNLIENISKQEIGFEKTFYELCAACDAYDKQEKLFNDTRAQAVSVLKQWLGPNPMNQIYNVLNELGPKNAWKRLVDSYDSEAQTSIYLNSVSTMMNNLKFSKTLGSGKVVDHMAYLDRLNSTLVRKGRGKSDGELMQHLVSAIQRSKEAMDLYGSALQSIFNENKQRTAAIDLLTRVEHERDAIAQMNGERKNSAGAQFAKVQGAFAGTASTSRDHEKKGRRGKKRKHNGGGDNKGKKNSISAESQSSSGGGATPANKKKKRECTRCGGDHLRPDCEEEVFCTPCNSNTHSEGMCWKKHPEKNPFLRGKKDN